MGKGLFITGTDTDVGKTYVTALLVKTLREAGYDGGYYKAAVSGAETVEESDAGFVNRMAGIGDAPESLLSYLYRTPVSPHLAARLEGRPVEKAVVLADWARARAAHDYVAVEGSGGICCPIRRDREAVYGLGDIVHWLGIPSLIVADAGLGTINHVVLTAYYMAHHDLPVKGVILNHWKGGVMEEDNVTMIEAMAGVPVVARVSDGDTALAADPALLASLFA